MSGTEKEGSGAVDVRIYGRTYTLRSDGDAERLRRLAEIVDRKMNEIAEATSTPDTLKVAIMAALNIANDSLEAGTGGTTAPAAPTVSTPTPEDVEARLDRLVTLLDEALAG